MTPPDRSGSGRSGSQRSGSEKAGSERDATSGPDSARRRGGAGEGVAGTGESRRTIVNRQKAEHGGVKIGSAFFGFLTAVGVGVLLTALLSAAGAAVGLSSDAQPGRVVEQATSSAETVGIVGGIVLLGILFVAYFCGGYVAARMARFDGIKQGVAVWVWAIVVAIVVAVLGAVAGDQFNILSELNAFPRIPIGEGKLTTGGIVAAVAVVVASLVGAILGGLAGMRFHRQVDRTGLGA